MKRIAMMRLLFAIIFPIIILLCLLLYKQSIINTGQSVTLAIVGFDPRDLLSGHYLRYRIDYKSENTCQNVSGHTTQLCLKPQRYFLNNNDIDSAQSRCDIYLKGVCQHGKFSAGIERFYIPEQYAAQLDTLVRDARGELKISVNSAGTAVIEDLLIDGEAWQNKVQ